MRIVKLGACLDLNLKISGEKCQRLIIHFHQNIGKYWQRVSALNDAGDKLERTQQRAVLGFNSKHNNKSNSNS
jgi:hypothetical protein